MKIFTSLRVHVGWLDGLAASLIVLASSLSAATPLEIVQQAYVKASPPGQDARLGYSLAASGDTVVVGAPFAGGNRGIVYVFVRSGTNWSEQVSLRAANDSFYRFGWSVGISGNTLVVGAPSERGAAVGVNGPEGACCASGSGAAYIFLRTGTNWARQAYLKASNTEAGDEFGNFVAVSGDTVVIGAFNEDSDATGVNSNQFNNSSSSSGAAYVFARAETNWAQQAYLKASNTEAGDRFGVAVAISGNTIVVGADNEDSSFAGIENTPFRTVGQDDNSAPASGAAYVFGRVGTNWTQQAYLKASNVGANDQFGVSVAASGNTVVVGAWLEDGNGVNGSDNSVPQAGAAYVFVGSGTPTVWSQQAYLKAPNVDLNSTPGDFFGSAVAVSEDIVVVGASREDSNARGVNGDGSNNGEPSAGAAYVFVRTGTPPVWNHAAYLKASNSDDGDFFGWSVATDAGTVIAGAYAESVGALESGAAYIFTGFFPSNGPEIAVEYPVGVNLIDGSAFIELGVVPVGSSHDLVFTIRNNGNEELTGLSITIDGDHAADFSVLVVPAPSVASAGSTSFTVRFAPGAVWLRSARLHLASNDADENPFDITLISPPTAPEYLIDTIAGTGFGGFSGDNGLATEAQLSTPYGVAVDSAGIVYVADSSNHRVRRIGTDGIITTFAGNGIDGFNGDGGPANQAQLSFPAGVAVDTGGNVYIADFYNSRVRRVDTNGIITTFAGTGISGYSGDGGPATQAQVDSLSGLCVDSTGNVYLSDAFYHVVRRVDSNGVITTVAGSGLGGFSGDGGLATLAQLNLPTGVAVDSIGNLFIADHYRVRRVGTNGIINTIAGNGVGGFRGDGGPALQAQLEEFEGIVESAGHVFVGANLRIRRVDASGVIVTVAGDGRPGGTDGPNAMSSPVGFVSGLAKDGAGNIVFTSGNRVRRLRPTGQTFPVKPIYASTPSAGTLSLPYLRIEEFTSTEVKLFIGNVGRADLRIDSIGFTDTNAPEVSILGLPGLPRIIPPGFSHYERHGIELTFRWTPTNSGVLESGVRVVSNDPVNPVAIYHLVGEAYDPAARVFESAFVGWVATVLGRDTNHRSKSGGETLALNGTQTAILTIDPNSSPTLTAEIPAFLGGGSIQLSNFAGSVTVSLIPIPNDFERASIRVEGGSMTAPSVQLPSGLETGLNRLTFGSPEQSGGILFLTNGSYTAYAAARIVNNLIPDGVAVSGNYSGIYNPETGAVSSQSQSTDFFERSDRVLLSSSTNGFWLTWANTNGIEEATNILGPWRPMTNAASPFAVVTTKLPQQFFRLQIDHE